jgi:hypothetical protein
MFFIFPYTVSDGCNYWGESSITFTSRDEETAFISIFEIVELEIAKHKDFFKSFTADDLIHMSVKIQGEDISLDNFIDYSQKSINFTLVDLNEYLHNLKENSKPLFFKDL